ncbi:hypothetical protein Cgig2_000598 [Carnegiea gigantea]|uniref:Uncharacterized protein n=1 Tax=Carnegiea gigantea TaxID=171969 RepID=A0A9Q1GJD7_9CARY|nr:hypothetical protein Cgig2_000598 [Carnegiea gigantea]
MEKSIEHPSKNDPLEGETHERESLSPRFLCFPYSLTLIQTLDLPPSPSPLLFFVVSSSPSSMSLAMLGMSPRLLCSDNDFEGVPHHSQPFWLNFMSPRTPLAQIYLTSPSLVIAARVYWPLFVGRFVGRCCIHCQIQHVWSKGMGSLPTSGQIYFAYLSLAPVHPDWATHLGSLPPFPFIPDLITMSTYDVSGCGYGWKGRDAALNAQFLVQIGVFTVVSMIMGFILEQGLLKVSFMTSICFPIA